MAEPTSVTAKQVEPNTKSVIDNYVHRFLLLLEKLMVR